MPTRGSSKQAWELIGTAGPFKVYRWVTEVIRLELHQLTTGDPPAPGTHGWADMHALLRHRGALPFVFVPS